MAGVHRRGEFFETRRYELGAPELEDVARAAQPGLKKLRQLLQGIQDAMMSRGKDARLSLVCRQGVLQAIESSNPCRRASWSDSWCNP